MPPNGKPVLFRTCIAQLNMRRLDGSLKINGFKDNLICLREQMRFILIVYNYAIPLSRLQEYKVIAWSVSVKKINAKQLVEVPSKCCQVIHYKYLFSLQTRPLFTRPRWSQKDIFGLVYVHQTIQQILKKGQQIRYNGPGDMIIIYLRVKLFESSRCSFIQLSRGVSLTTHTIKYYIYIYI